MVSQGTNDLRKNKLDDESAYSTLAKLAGDIHKMTNKPVFLNQLPPINLKNREDLATQIALLNQRIADTEAEGLRPALNAHYLGEYLLEEILDDRDGIHLINEGLEVFAKALKEAVMTIKEPDTDKKSQSGLTLTKTSQNTKWRKWS